MTSRPGGGGFLRTWPGLVAPAYGQGVVLFFGRSIWLKVTVERSGGVQLIHSEWQHWDKRRLSESLLLNTCCVQPHTEWWNMHTFNVYSTFVHLLYFNGIMLFWACIIVIPCFWTCKFHCVLWNILKYSANIMVYEFGNYNWWERSYSVTHKMIWFA